MSTLYSETSKCKSYKDYIMNTNELMAIIGSFHIQQILQVNHIRDRHVGFLSAQKGKGETT